MGQVLRRDDDAPVKRVRDLEVDGIRGKGRPNMSWKAMV